MPRRKLPPRSPWVTDALLQELAEMGKNRHCLTSIRFADRECGLLAVLLTWRRTCKVCGKHEEITTGPHLPLESDWTCECQKKQPICGRDSS